IAGLLARRLGGPRAGVLAALFLALCPALVSRGSIIIVDTTAALCAVCALFFAVHLADEELASQRVGVTALLAGSFSGLAFTAKYTVGAVFAAVLAAIVLRRSRARETLRLAALACAGGVAAALLAMPPLLFKPGVILGGLVAQSHFYSNPFSFDPHNTDKSYLAQLFSPKECGIALSAAGLAGVGWLLARRRTRSTALSWIAFA